MVFRVSFVFLHRAAPGGAAPMGHGCARRGRHSVRPIVCSRIGNVHGWCQPAFLPVPASTELRRGGHLVTPPEASGRGFTLRQWQILATVQLSTLLFGMTITAANVVLPQIKGALSATQDQVAWVVTFNLVATAIATPMTGWLAAKLGWRKVMVGSLAGFVLASALCAMAPSLTLLVVSFALPRVRSAPP